MTLRKPGSLTSGDIDAVRLVGPIAPATKRGSPGLAGPRIRRPPARASRAAFAIQLVRQLLHPVVGHGDGGGVEGVGLDDVRAGLEVRAVDVRDDLRPGEREEVVVPLEVPRPVGEPLAAVVPLVEPVGLDHRPHGAVQHQDPLLQERIEAGEPRVALARVARAGRR